MSTEVLVDLAKQVARDFGFQQHVETLPDEKLAELGLDPDEISSIRDGFFDRVLQMGIVLDDSPPSAHGCCFG